MLSIEQIRKNEERLNNNLSELNNECSENLLNIQKLKLFLGLDFESNKEEINNMISEFTDRKFDSKEQLSIYIKELESEVEIQKRLIKKTKEKIDDIQRQLLLTPEETDSRLREMVHQTNMEVFSKLLPFLLGRVEDLREMLSGEDCSPQDLLQKICSILKLDDREAILRIETYFEDKTREQILSDHGLVIILAISNIVGYSEEYERSMKGMFLDDRWMFDELFVEDPKFGLVSFPSLVYRAFEHPFIQSSLLIEDESAREKLNSSLRCMNDFSRRLHDINQEVLLTMNRSSVSDGRRMLFADRYFLWVPDIWHVLPTPSEKNLLSESGI